MTDLALNSLYRSAALAYLKTLTGMQLVSVEPHPEADAGVVVTLRAVGRRAHRHVALVAIDGVLHASEVFADSRIMRQVAARRIERGTA